MSFKVAVSDVLGMADMEDTIAYLNKKLKGIVKLTSEINSLTNNDRNVVVIELLSNDYTPQDYILLGACLGTAFTTKALSSGTHKFPTQ